MNYPDEFEYNDKTDVKTYTRTPQKIISIPRLIQNKPYWEKMTSVSQRTKKTLIVTDWTARAWREDKILSEILLVLGDLLKTGFTLYLWQSGSLYPLLDVEWLNSDAVLKNVTPEFPQKIMQIAVEELKLAAYKIQLLDDYQLLSLVAGSPIEKRFISYNALKMYCRDLDAMKIIHSLLRTSKPRINWVDQQDKQRLIAQDLNIQFESNIRPYSPKSLNISVMPPLDAFLSTIEQVESLELLFDTNDIDNRLLSEMFSTRLKRLSLENVQLTSETLQHILALKHLRYLRLENVRVEGSFSAPNSTLTALVIRGWDIEHLTNDILKNTPYLQHLELQERWAGHNSYIALEQQYMSSLRNLRTLISNCLDLPHFLQTLEYTPQLIALKIDTDGDDGIEPAEPIRLPELRCFTFVGGDPTPWFNEECFHAPKLSQLKLNSDNEDKPESNTNTMAQKSLVMDADTIQYSGVRQSVNKIFYSTQQEADPGVHTYRTRVFDQLNLIEQPASINEVFELNNTFHGELIPLNNAPEMEDVFALATTAARPCWYGKQAFYLDHSWTALASLSPTESLLHYHVSPDIHVDISYSEHDNLYYIRAREADSKGTPVVVDFLLTVETECTLPSTLQETVNDLRQFGSGELSLDHNELSGEDVLHAMKTQRVGSCRHRAMLLKSMLDDDNIPARIVLNDCHAFVEAQGEGVWLTCDLSGYPIEHLELNEPEKPALLTQLSVSEQQLFFQHQLATYNPIEAGEHFFATLFNDVHKNKLIYIESNAILNFSLMLQAEALKNNHDVFCINHPDDFSCYSGGTLHQLITTERERPLVLILNFDRLPAENIVSGNSSFEINPRIEGVLLPPGTRIIGLIDPDKPGSYNGSDLSSRFSGQVVRYSSSDVPVYHTVLNPITEENSVADLYVINLSHSSAWLTQLLGGPVIKNNEIGFEPGELSAALASGKPIELLNPPQDELFDYFWKVAKLHKRIIYQHQVIPFPDHIALHYRHAYHWINSPIIRRTETVSDHAHVLNPGVLHRFMSDYQCVNGVLNHTNGILSELYSEGDVVELLMTRILNDDEADQLITACEKRKLSLAVKGSNHLKPNKRTKCILTQDSDAVIASMKEFSLPYIIIDCSECTSFDLLERIDIQVISHHPRLKFECKTKESVLTNSLNKGLLVVLTGSFSEALRDELAPFLISRMRQENPSGSLVILTNQPFNYLPMEKGELPYDKRQQALSFWFGEQECNLGLLNQEMSNDLTKLSFTECRARLMYLNANPSVTTSQGTWQGFETVALSTSKQPLSSHPMSRSKEARQFDNTRYKLVNDAFCYAPYVFIAGLTGVGKSHFVHHVLARNPLDQHKVFSGVDMTTRRSWAKARTESEGFLVLFIDEANLAACEWSEFEGLFYPSPGILIEGDFYPLTHNHKVLFAGNPLSYGDARHVASLFKRHGHAVVFDPLPVSVVFHSCIKPLFLKLSLSSNKIKSEIIRELVNRYNFFVSIAQDDVLITPRQIQMILLLVIAFEETHPGVSAEEVLAVLCLYANQVLASLVPKAHQEKFNQCFPAVERPVCAQVQFPFKGPSGHYYLPSRYEASYRLFDFLTLRNVLINNPDLPDSGLKRVIIESDSGLGKSRWLRDMLKWLKIPYHDLPASMYSNERRCILLNAFDQGELVIMDEINSISSMEEFMNSLLDGKHPDEQGRKPHHSGFRIIGTQNSASLAGRSLVSPALLNRTLTIHLQPYTFDEMVSILDYMGLSPETCYDMVAAYEHNVDKARRENLHPVPVFRNLIDLASSIISAERTHTESVFESIWDEDFDFAPEFPYLAETSVQPERRATPLSELSFLSVKRARTETPFECFLDEEFTL